MRHSTMQFELVGPDDVTLPLFYAELFGWDADASFLMRWGVIRPTDPETNGSVRPSPGWPPMVTFYVQTDNLRKTLKKAEALGAVTVQQPRGIPGGPVLAKFADPRGNVVGLVEGM